VTGHVLITGSATRLGAAIARHLAAAGWTPIIHYKSSVDQGERLASELGTFALQADLDRPETFDAFMNTAIEKAGGPLRGLVNSASIFEHDRPETVTTDALETHFATNTAAPVLLASLFAKLTTASDPVIVNILDQKLWNPHPDHFSYTLSKAALETATRLMAQAFAPRVRVCGVAPGYTLPAPGEDDAEFDRKAAKVNALQRRLEPDHVAQAVRFCLECPAVTGQTLLADNGEHLVPTERDVSFKVGAP
jgi:NAD(P)-dependent dehydrogenase (short-subunit alcohol dehydrogenase family)